MTQPTSLPGADDLLTGGGRGRRAKFGAKLQGESPVDGTVHEGTVIEAFSQQQTTYDPVDASKSNKPKFYDNGKPAMELVIVFQTTEREDQTDDGVRSVYAKGNLLAMIRESIQSQGLPGIRAGGYIKMQFVHQEKIPVRKNIFRAKYTAPAPVSDDFFDEPAPAAAPASVNGHGQPQSAEPPDWAVTPPTTAQVHTAPAGASNSMLHRLRDQAQGAPVPATPAQDFDF